MGGGYIPVLDWRGRNRSPLERECGMIGVPKEFERGLKDFGKMPKYKIREENWWRE
ncbi:MAG: hypothetical protein ACPL7L_01900 [bacterium]